VCTVELCLLKFDAQTFDLLVILDRERFGIWERIGDLVGDVDDGVEVLN
jgi:hypothetical protein